MWLCIYDLTTYVWLKRNKSKRIKYIKNHCCQEANQCADKLVRIGSSQSLDFVVYHSPLVDILSSLEEDASGLYLKKLSPKTSSL